MVSYLNGENAEISIHAPRAGGDEARRLQCCFQALFQSTPPVRGATTHFGDGDFLFEISIHAPRAGGDGYDGRIGLYVDISIHAPRAGGDAKISDRRVYEIDFNPRPPCGGRHALRALKSRIKRFQSTPPVRGATG